MLSLTAQSLRSCPVDANPSKSNSEPASQRAFTLIELLTVIAIIGILSAITFGVVKGVNERAAIGQAKAELGALSQSLEAYKMQYGDYPRTASNAEMLDSLLGKRGPTGTTGINGKKFIESAKLTLSTATSPTVQDPWGRDYLYIYNRTSPASPAVTPWKNPSYVLFSMGPDGKSYGTASTVSALVDSNTGIVQSSASTDTGAADNIYTNK